ncbi:MAG: hypothetical protein CMJ83_13610 [Planctomycetes bacterium]|nr:hypothetical protein [Planctomycetota bacterium]
MTRPVVRTLAVCLCTTAWVLGQIPCSASGALLYDGVDDFVIVADAASLDFEPTEPFTVEAWFRTTVLPSGPPFTSPNPYPSLVEKWNGSCGTPYPYAVRLNQAGMMSGSVFDTSNCQAAAVTFGQPGAVSDDQWHHVAFCRDPGLVHRLYVDGVEVDSDAGLPTMTTANDVPLYIGRRGPAGPFTNFWTGIIDEVRISSTCRYSSEFRPETRHEPDADTVLLLHFDEGAGQFAFDSSGESNHAQLGVTGLSGIDDPAWTAGLARNRADLLVTSVNGGPLDGTFKFISALDTLRFGLTADCPDLNGRAAAIILNSGPEATMNGVTPPSFVAPPVPGIVALHGFSEPTGAALIMGDGIGIGITGLSVGFPPLFVGDPVLQFDFPMGMPAGLDMRMQAVFVLPETPNLIFGATNEVLLQLQ